MPVMHCPTTRLPPPAHLGWPGALTLDGSSFAHILAAAAPARTGSAAGWWKRRGVGRDGGRMHTQCAGARAQAHAVCRRCRLHQPSRPTPHARMPPAAAGHPAPALGACTWRGRCPTPACVPALAVGVGGWPGTEQQHAARPATALEGSIGAHSGWWGWGFGHWCPTATGLASFPGQRPPHRSRAVSKPSSAFRMVCRQPVPAFEALNGFVSCPALLRATSTLLLAAPAH